MSTPESRVLPVRQGEALELGGADLTILAAGLRTAHTGLRSRDVPEHPRPSTGGSVRRDAKRSFGASYSTLDPPHVSSGVSDALVKFDGHQPTTEVRQVITNELGASFEDETPHSLIDFGISLSVSQMRALEGSSA